MPLDWAWSGATALAAGATAYIPPRRLAIASPVTILGVQYFGRTGGDVFELYYNGAALGSPQQWTTVSETWETDTSSVFPFDASDGDTFRPVVETAAGDGIVSGTVSSSGASLPAFGPSTSINRAELAKILTLAMGKYRVNPTASK